MNWQPIETAPKDKTVDLWDGYARYIDCVFSKPSSRKELEKCWCEFDDRGWWYSPVNNPTHWMKVEPPTTTKDSCEE